MKFQTLDGAVSLLEKNKPKFVKKFSKYVHRNSCAFCTHPGFYFWANHKLSHHTEYVSVMDQLSKLDKTLLTLGGECNPVPKFCLPDVYMSATLHYELNLFRLLQNRLLTFVLLPDFSELTSKILLEYHLTKKPPENFIFLDSTKNRKERGTIEEQDLKKMQQIIGALGIKRCFLFGTWVYMCLDDTYKSLTQSGAPSLFKKSQVRIILGASPLPRSAELLPFLGERYQQILKEKTEIKTRDFERGVRLFLPPDAKKNATSVLSFSKWVKKIKEQ